MHPLAEIQTILETARFAVLATQDCGQPHASLVAMTPIRANCSILFATYRSTRKFANLSRSNRVALFIGDQIANHSESESPSVLTTHGIASEAPLARHDELACKHAERHPQLAEMLDSMDCALVLVRITAYEIVQSIDQVRWWNVSPAPYGDELPAGRDVC